jgi:4-amino-4-deoxy-L-arabinose transferase-like glycosyltransferase
MFIQESLFACFALACLVAAGRAVVGGGLGWSIAAGAAAGLALATKETSVIVIPAVLASCAIAWWSLRSPDIPPIAPSHRRSAALASLLGAVVVAGLFYSSFLTAPAALLEPFRAITTYLERGIDPAAHAHPWHYYLSLLAYSASGGLRWSEGVVLVLAVAGGVSGWIAPRATPASDLHRLFWTRAVTAYVVLTTAMFSGIAYKTPWNLLPFYVAAIVLAGIGFAALVRAAKGRALTGLLVAGFAVAALHLGGQAWRASVTYAADPRNPYVYAQTVPDAVRMAARIRDLARLHPNRSDMQVSVIAAPHEQWPLPWYLRTMTNVGYWTAPGDPLALKAPVIVTSMDHADSLDRALDERYVSQFYGLRPDVLMTLYVERGLWDVFLADVTGNASLAP